MVEWRSKYPELSSALAYGLLQAVFGSPHSNYLSSELNIFLWIEYRFSSIRSSFCID
jgi:hypothetical protein